MEEFVSKFDKFVNEKVEYHEKLNETVWEGSEMKKEIRTKLLAIAADFWASLKLNVLLMDVQLTGSLANYNWTKYSDFDVHLIIDFSQVDTNTELVRTALDGQRFMWNERHHVVIEGFEVECYAQDVHQQHTSSGLFSLLRDSWIVVPTFNKPQVDEKDVREKVRAFKEDLKIAKEKAKSVKGKEAESLFNHLKDMKKKLSTDRQEGLSRGGEFSVENLVFKQLRNSGAIEHMIKALSAAYAGIYAD